MRTIGEILTEKRKELGLSLESVEKETRIRKKYLEAIEKNDFSQILESTIIKGFIRNYAQFLGLSPENALAVLRRDFKENKDGQIIPRGMVEPLVKKNFYWTPKATVITLIVASFTSFFFFFGRQYLNVYSAPILEVYSPVENQVIKDKAEVSGKTDKDASLKIDGLLVTVASDGSFKEQIVLPRGENILTIEASNRQGKKRTVNIKIKME